MIYPSSERHHSKIGATGLCDREDLVSIEQLGGCGRLLGVLTIPAGGSIPDHTHQGEFEVYYMLSGHGRYHENGTVRSLGPGDVAYCPAGESHGIYNDSDSEEIVFVAFIGFPVK